MTIDKQKLQKLLWAEAASFRADCADWKRNTEALQEFLGEKTVEEVALELLAENERLQSAARTLGHLRYTDNGAEIWKPPLGEKPDFRLVDQLKAENEALRKDAERYRWLQHGHSGYIEVVEWIGPHATGMTGEDLDALVDGAMAKAVQP